MAQSQNDSEQHLGTSTAFDPNIVKKVLSGKDYLNKDVFETPMDCLEFICQQYGLQFRQIKSADTDNDNGDFFEAVCDQQKRLERNTNLTCEDHDPRRLRKELVNFLCNETNRTYHTSSGEVNLKDYLPDKETFDGWLAKVKKGKSKIDHVTVIVMAILTKRDITLITSVPNGTENSNEFMTMIPAGKSLQTNDSILLGYDGESHFKSLEPIFDVMMSPESEDRLLPGIKLLKSDHKEDGPTGRQIDVEDLLRSSSEKKDLPPERKEFGVMTIQKDGNHKKIKPLEIISKSGETVETFPSPVVSFEQRKGELFINWWWHNDERHVVTTIMIVGRKFIDRSGIKWCDSKIVENETEVSVKQCLWEHRREDNKEQQKIDCLLPCITYRIFVIDHFQKVLHSGAIARTISELMYYTPSPYPLELHVVDKSQEEVLEFRWQLKDELSMDYIDSVELTIQNSTTMNNILVKKDDETGPLVRTFVLSNIKENIKVNVKVKRKPTDEAGQLFDETEFVVVHPPQPKRPENNIILWQKMKNLEKCFKLKVLNPTNRQELPQMFPIPIPSDIELDPKKLYQLSIETCKLKCGALTFPRSSRLPSISPSDSEKLQGQPPTKSSRPSHQEPAPRKEAAPQQGPPHQIEPPLQLQPPPQQECPRQQEPPHQIEHPPQQEHAPQQPSLLQSAAPTQSHMLSPSSSQRSKQSDRWDQDYDAGRYMSFGQLPALQRSSSGPQLRIPLKCMLNDNSVILSLDARNVISDDNVAMENDRNKSDCENGRSGDKAERRRRSKERCREDQEKSRQRNERERYVEERRRRSKERCREDQEKRRQRNERERYVEERRRKSKERCRDDQEKRRQRNERERYDEEIRRRSKERRREDQEKRRQRNERERYEEERRSRSKERRQRSNEKERQKENKTRRSEERGMNTGVYHPPEHTTIESPRRRPSGYFRILWKRPVQENHGMMYLSPYY